MGELSAKKIKENGSKESSAAKIFACGARGCESLALRWASAYLLKNLSVSSTLWEPVPPQGGLQQRRFRTTATGLAAAARKEGVEGLSFLSEDMHNTIGAACDMIVAEQNALCDTVKRTARTHPLAT